MAAELGFEGMGLCSFTDAINTSSANEQLAFDRFA